MISHLSKTHQDFILNIRNEIEAENKNEDEVENVENLRIKDEHVDEIEAEMLEKEFEKEFEYKEPEVDTSDYNEDQEQAKKFAEFIEFVYEHQDEYPE